MTNYNYIAPLYDVFKRVIFGDAITVANQVHLDIIPKRAHILIVGGGTGHILTQFTKYQHIDYIEPSQSMINISKKRSYSCSVNFYKNNIQDFIPESVYDVVVLPFVLDLFDKNQLKSVISKCDSMLAPQGMLLVSDFYPTEKLSKRWQKLLLRTVIVFFRITTNHKLTKIVNSWKTLQQFNYKLVTKKEYYHGMIFASVWKKAVH